MDVPDYEHFLRLRIWTTKQAACLLCGLAPDAYVEPGSRRKLPQTVDKTLDVLEDGVRNMDLETIDSWIMFGGHDKVLAVDAIRFASIRGLEVPDELQPLLESSLRDTDNDNNLDGSPHWQGLKALADQAIADYPAWRKTQGRSLLKTHIYDWLLRSMSTRDAQFVTKVVTDLFPES